jgi:Uma2 family endonuclease
MAETDWHRDLMTAIIAILKLWYAKARRVYVSGNLLLYYVPGNKRKHVSPDVFVVRGVSKRKRLYYLLWEEGKSPEMITEVTSKSTRKEDLDTKFKLYRDILKVQTWPNRAVGVVYYVDHNSGLRYTGDLWHGR